MSPEKCKKCGIGILCEIGNPKKIIHYLDVDERYLCNKACSVTKSKTTERLTEVTCQNCKRQLSGMGQ